MTEAHRPGATVIETPRLVLRELVPADLEVLAALYADADVMRFIGKSGALPRADAERYIDRQRTSYRERGFGEWGHRLAHDR